MQNNQALSTQQGFGDSSQQLAVVETASMALAAQSKAMVESRYIMAMRNPRDLDQVRLDVMKECKRPSFANNKSAYYVKPIGAGVEGLGIRFVEMALRCMKNILVETTMIFEDDQKEIHRVSVTDLEANITYPLDVRVSKTVERSKPNSDGTFISQRKNSYGKAVYTVAGNDDDILNKRGALISKAVRTLGLRIIPGDICDEAEEGIKKTRLNTAAQDPDAERKKIVDSFSGLGVSATSLADYLGHPLQQCSPAQIVELRGIYGAIKDGEATWKTVMENKEDREPPPESGAYKLGSCLALISSAKSKADLDNVSMDGLSAKDQKTAKAAWMKKNDEFKAKTTESGSIGSLNLSISDRINECASSAELTVFLDSITEAEQLEYDVLIDEKYDSFRQ